MTLASLFAVLWRGKWIILVLFLLSALAGAVYASRLVPVYTATATIALIPDQQNIVDLNSVIPGVSSDYARINTEIGVMRSRRLVGKLVDRLELTGDAEFNPALRPPDDSLIDDLVDGATNFLRDSIKNVQQRVLPGEGDDDPGFGVLLTERDVVINSVEPSLSIANEVDSYLFTITAATEDPRKSALLANTLADLYVLDQLEVKSEATERATRWLSDRVATLRVELEQASSAVNDFRSRTQLVSPEALATMNFELKNLRDRAEDLQGEVALGQSRVAALEEAAESGDRAQMAAIADDPELNRLLGMVERGEATPERFLSRYQQLMLAARSGLTRSQSQLDAVRQAVADKSVRVDSQSADLIRLRELERVAEASRLIYEHFLQRMKETAVQEGLQEADSRILSAAIPSPTPVSPRKRLIVFLSGALGLLVGGALVMYREARHQGVRSANELETLTGRPVLAQIPLVPARRRSNVLRYLTEKPSSAAAEAVRNLRTSLLLSNIDKPPQVILFTSAVPRDGKTTTSLALAHSFAGLGGRTIIIDCDIRRHTLSDHFAKESRPGIVSVLTGAHQLEEAIYRSDSDFDVLLGKDLENSSANAADIFTSQRFSRLVDELRLKYDTIIIDTPPVMAVPNARILGQVADAIVVGVRWNGTPGAQIVAGVESIERDNLSITGLVLTQVNQRAMRQYGYGNRYGSYYGYSEYYKS